MADGVQLNPYTGQNAMAHDVGSAGGKILATQNGGTSYLAIPAANGTTVVKAAPGRLCKIIVLTLAAGIISVFDNASAASGTLLYKFTTNTPIGTVVDLEIPALNGITLDMIASTPQVLVTFI